MFITRRQFLKTSAGTVAALAIADRALALTALQPVIEVGNPLGDYPQQFQSHLECEHYRPARITEYALGIGEPVWPGRRPAIGGPLQ